jgi:hypothetical protein
MKESLENNERGNYEQFESLEIDNSKVEKRKKKEKSFLYPKKIIKMLLI